MNVFEAVQKRHSVRAYAPTPVPSELVEQLLESARLSPSASNIQPWHFVVVTDSEKRQKLASMPTSSPNRQS